MIKLIEKIKNAFTGEKTSCLQLMQQQSYGSYIYNGDYYRSDIVRACIRPFANAVGKLSPKVITVYDGKLKTMDNDFFITLLKNPNPYMTGQVLFEKIANQLKLNNNAFCYIIRNLNGLPVALYPISAISVEKKYDADGNLFLNFRLKNNNEKIFSYEDVIHLRKDFTDEDDILGESPARVLQNLMQVVECGDDAVVKAVKNGGMLKWILTVAGSFKADDLKKRAREFENNYLSIGSNAVAAAQDNSQKIEQLKPNDYVPNATLQDKARLRLYSFYGTNEKIVNANYTEDEWTAYFENEIEPVAMQMSQEFTRKLLSNYDKQQGKQIVFDAKNLQFASMATKLNLLQMVDRGAMTPNEWRATLNLSAIENGDKPIRRLDTAVVKEGESENK